MASAALTRRNGGGLFEGLYKVIMRRNSVYVTFVIAGAFLGERAVDYGVHKLWEQNNVGEYNLPLHRDWNLKLSGTRTFQFWVRGNPNKSAATASIHIIYV
ncbi:hypothetical protein M9H77_11082 [Catharanthus roseus]|uniref:Uncharacterized protein n=1 Tax=Catharanthus roseus TaxID=4058 RepID=A0ACC0BDT7_CATRO|nr:hypothetical protein M9H77_11082 [Catharanthus roseus]